MPSAKLTLAEELLLFFVLFNLSRKAMQYLLDILVRHGIDTPKTVFLLKKSTNVEKIHVDINNDENFVYLGLKNNLSYIVRRKFSFLNIGFNDLNIQINVDGLPLYKSSNVSLWPILMKIYNVTMPFPIALYCGIGKPKLDTFLSKLCAELTDILTNHFSVNSYVFRISNVIFVCDTPARTFCQCIKGHTAYFGCGYCQQVGTYVNKTIAFSCYAGTSRSDISYFNFEENNQLSISPLASIVPLMTNFPPDYMHVVLLGVTRKLFHFYFSRTKGKRLACRLSEQQITSLSADINFLRAYVPCEFQRKIRNFSELSHFKASEFRTYLLYFAPICFKNYLPDKYFKHFMLLHYSIYVFCSSNFQDLHEKAARCIEIFVYDMKDLFSEESITYNVHVLLHLPYFVKKYGSLDIFSAFPYENYLSVLKKRIKSTRHVLKHSVNQLIIIRDIYSTMGLCSSSSLQFKINSANNCAILSNGVVILVDNMNDNTVSGYILLFSHNLYNYPYNSRDLCIGYYAVSTKYLCKKVAISKAICIPSDNFFIVVPYVS
jgi:hypothetical protein